MDGYSAGWRASGYVVLAANHTLRAIPVSAGKHTITLEYAPPSVAIGLWISAITCVAFAGVVAAMFIRRRLAARRLHP